MAATVITQYLGQGLAAARPATPAVATGAMALWYSTDTKQFSVYAGGVWKSFGFTSGTIPTVVQSTFDNDGGLSAVFGVAPTNGNLLIAMCFNTGTQTAGSGWTRVATSSTGTDFGSIFTKVAGAAESTTQTPISGTATTGAMVIWEINGQAGSGFLVAASTQAQQTAETTVSVLFPNLANCLGLSAVAVVPSPTILSVRNGTQDVLANTNGRYIAANHTDLSQTPMAGVFATFSASASHKCATCLIASV